MVVHEHEFLVYIDIDEFETDDATYVLIFLILLNKVVVWDVEWERKRLTVSMNKIGVELTID
jgi:hypothetical protein